MKRIASQFALLVLAGSLMAVSPTLAAPPSGGPDCRDPSQAKSPACMNMHKGQPGKGQPGKASPSGQGPFGMSPAGNGPPPVQAGPPPGPKGPPGPPPPPGPSGPPSHSHKPPPGAGMGSPGMGMGSPGMGAPGHKGPGSMGPGHNGPPGGFDAFRRGYRFPHFAPPRFDVRPGISVPRDYGLRPLPPQIFAFYPMYRGYLFFVAPGGRIVIVSPRSLRIVAVL